MTISSFFFFSSFASDHHFLLINPLPAFALGLSQPLWLILPFYLPLKCEVFQDTVLGYLFILYQFAPGVNSFLFVLFLSLDAIYSLMTSKCIHTRVQISPLELYIHISECLLNMSTWMSNRLFTLHTFNKLLFCPKLLHLKPLPSQSGRMCLMCECEREILRNTTKKLLKE